MHRKALLPSTTRATFRTAVEEFFSEQEKLWNGGGGLDTTVYCDILWGEGPNSLIVRFDTPV